ncbi:hypothetical protein MKW98_013316 [Papaver atlanticum]|uniref:F-box domain-containing protein n=1 Tax=Papaver atlanticum TaxID=357466 RepID=A0AAD4STR0_9MAGN|nr:hypothetical protein MKW98_013316 [Papaver atlanticum]
MNQVEESSMKRTDPTDRISELPDTVLSHILSSIPTKSVVRTSILAKRWRYIWKSVPVMDFDENLFPRQTGNAEHENTSFVGFVDRVMESHDDTDIRKLRLAFFDADIARVNKWIQIAIDRNVRELLIETPKNYVEFTESLFSCDSLVYLKFDRSYANLKLPESFCFSSLRTLCLSAVYFPENALLVQLLSGCPVLQDLDMNGCRWSMLEREVEISSPTVTTLSLDGSCPVVRSNGDCKMKDRTIKICIPNVKSFKYIDHIAKDYNMESHLSLVNAFIDVRIGEPYWSEAYENCGYSVVNLLKGLSNARYLSLSDSTLELLCDASDLEEVLPKFPNLEKLVIISGRHELHFIAIAFLLQSSPVLKTLEIQIESSPKYKHIYDQEEGYGLAEGEGFENLYLHCLKEVKICGFGDSENELNFVKLLLRVANKTKINIIKDRGDIEINVCT